MKTETSDWEQLWKNIHLCRGLLTQMTQKQLKLNHKENKQLTLKMGKNSELIPHQKRYTDQKQAYEKMVNIISH